MEAAVGGLHYLYLPLALSFAMLSIWFKDVSAANLICGGFYTSCELTALQPCGMWHGAAPNPTLHTRLPHLPQTSVGLCPCVHVEVLRICFVYVVLKIAWYLADTRKTLTVVFLVSIVVVAPVTVVATGAVINFRPIGLR